ncbi:MAG: uL15 family ribosomal protein, partial [Thermoanaerobaculia bacterium]
LPRRLFAPSRPRGRPEPASPPSSEAWLHEYFRKEWTTVSVEALERMFNSGDAVTLEALKNAGVKKTSLGVKVLGSGELKKALVVSAHHFTEGAKKKIEAAGGRCEVVAR